LKTFSELLRENQSKFHAVVPFQPEGDKLLLFDFSDANQQLNAAIVNDTRIFIDYVNQKLASANAKYGIGGYNEKRRFYARSQVFDSSPGEEPRRLHLGIDVWGKPYTAVMSPLDGIIHSFAFNDEFGNYGATLVLTHRLAGISFHTLYGHLSLNSIKNCRAGARIDLGDVIGEFGIPIENGQWPPHLHFQVIGEMGDWYGDYPGVCRESEKETYLENCPDPDLILQMMKFAQP
jgi:peptidoglycan LD-endopeptidase LytH